MLYNDLKNTAMLYKSLEKYLKILHQYNKSIDPQDFAQKYYVTDMIGMTELRMTLAMAIISKKLQEIPDDFPANGS